MDATSICDRRGDLVGYLYGECEADERRRIEAHLVSCESCAAEVGALRSVRRSLAAWVPPDAELGFRIVSDPPRNEVAWWRRLGQARAWGVAAAAAGIVAALAVGALDFRWEGDGVVVRMGRPVADRALTAVAAAAPDRPAPEAADDVLMQRIRTLIEQSERRQEQEFATRLLGLAQEFDLQRREDQIRIQQEVGALTDYLVRVSAP
ncbi:MAG: zf-HC2 domain-containing protein [Acidobacteria bacterium]|nr:zf-HC2 domain-containing protein [Acidobacteriota bacterium]